MNGEDEDTEGGKKPKARNKPKNPQDWVVEFGLDVNKKDYIFSYNVRLLEFLCNWCRKYYPFSLSSAFSHF